MKLEENKNWTGFKKWYSDFQAEYGSLSVPKSVYDITEKCHNDIRELIDGKSVSKNIKIDSSKNFMFGYCRDNTDYYLNAILNNVPKYLQEYKLKKEDLLKPSIGKVKTSRHILTYARKCLKGIGNQWQIDDVEYFVSRLEEEKARYKIKNRNLEVSLHTTLESFVHLGHYGADEGSCFAQNGGSSGNKLNLANVKDSFVVLIKNGERVVGRCWGIYNKDEEYVIVSNFYTKVISIPEAKQACKQFFDEIFGKELKVDTEKRLYDGDATVYINEDDVTFFVKEPVFGDVSLDLFEEREVEEEYAY